MKLLWLCNTQPGVVREAASGRKQGPVNWVDHVLLDLIARGEELRVLCPGDGACGTLPGGGSYATFRSGKPYQYLPEQERFFREQIRQFAPEVIHLWGVEFAHALAMANAAESAGMLGHTVASIQGLCGVCARHYREGVPEAAAHGFTLRDFLRQDNICQQQAKFARRGVLEKQTLQKLSHVIGRTDWDRACTRAINPALTYHFCNETLREPFYEGQWRYCRCRKHRIFASSKSYPVKGFHYLLEILPQLRERYPDVTLAVTGDSCLGGGFSAALRREGYARYLGELIRRNGLGDCVEFLGGLSAEEMKRAYLEANVFALPSTVENSPNSLGEAMLLGVPCVAALVGGVGNLMGPGEGFAYQSTAPYMLSHYIQRVFDMGEEAEKLGESARLHAQATHNPEANLEALLEIYRLLA